MDDVLEGHPRIKITLALIVLTASFAFFASGLLRHHVEGMESQDIGFAHEMFEAGRMNLPADQSPLYYGILYLSERLTQDSFAWLRLPSAVFAAFAVLFIFLLMSYEFGYAGGLLAAAILALNPFFVHWSQIARLYALMAMAAAGCLLFLYQYIYRGRRVRDLAGFILFAAVGIYTHMYFMIFVGSMGLLFIADMVWNRTAIVRVFIAGAVGLLAVYPQVSRIRRVMGYAAGNMSPGDLKHQPLPFLGEMAKEFFAGLWKTPDFFQYVVIALVVLFFLGMILLKWRGILLGFFTIVPAMAATWHFSEKSPMSPRYIFFLIPLVPIFLAAAVVKLKRFHLWIPLALFLLGQGVYLAVLDRATPPLDWADAARFIEQRRQPGEPVAVFPAEWDQTFRRWYHNDDLLTFMAMENLERFRSRGERLFVVYGPNKYFGNIDHFLKTRAKVLSDMKTKAYRTLSVFQLDAKRPEGFPPRVSDDPTLMLGGVVGSGGYPWQLESSGENPFGRIADAFASADFSMAGYVSYAPFHPKPLEAWRKSLFQVKDIPPREPGAAVAAQMAAAGLRNLMVLPGEGGGDPGTILAGAGIAPVSILSRNAGADPVYRTRVKDTDFAFIGIGQSRTENGRSAAAEGWKERLRQAREDVGPDGRVIAFLSRRPDYDRLFTDADRDIARTAIDLGADAVVGIGGWAAGEIEQYGRGVIAYSLGTLLRGPQEPRCLLDSTGLLLRLSFPKGERPRWEARPVTFDDLFRTAYDDKEIADSLVIPPEDGSAVPLRGRLRDAAIEMEAAPGKKSAFRWNEVLGASQSLHEGYLAGSVHVGLCGALSGGIFHRALEFDPHHVSKLRAVFRDVPMGAKLRIRYGVEESHIISITRPPQVLAVRVGKKEVLRRQVRYVTGWETADIDTADLAGGTQEITIELHANAAKSWPVAIDPVILRDPE